MDPGLHRLSLQYKYADQIDVHTYNVFSRVQVFSAVVKVYCMRNFVPIYQHRKAISTFLRWHLLKKTAANNVYCFNLCILLLFFDSFYQCFIMLFTYFYCKAIQVATVRIFKR